MQAAAKEKLDAATATCADLGTQREQLEARVAAMQAETEGLQRDLLVMQVSYCPGNDTGSKTGA